MQFDPAVQDRPAIVGLQEVRRGCDFRNVERGSPKLVRTTFCAALIAPVFWLGEVEAGWGDRFTAGTGDGTGTA